MTPVDVIPKETTPQGETQNQLKMRCEFFSNVTLISFGIIESIMRPMISLYPILVSAYVSPGLIRSIR